MQQVFQKFCSQIAENVGMYFFVLTKIKSCLVKHLHYWTGLKSNRKNYKMNNILEADFRQYAL